jgi:FkbM family methyltransferase
LKGDSGPTRVRRTEPRTGTRSVDAEPVRLAWLQSVREVGTLAIVQLLRAAPRRFSKQHFRIAMRALSGTVVTNTVQGHNVSFFVADERDSIQKHHRAGHFYEAEELAMIADHVRPGSTFVDVGANVGNHTIYACIMLGAGHAVVFEPNPPAVELCRINLALNGLLPLVDTSGLGIGLSDTVGMAAIVPMPSRARIPLRRRSGNLGGAQLQPGDETGPIRLVCGDEALAGQEVDFVKIDVEGMEMRVLAGLQETLRRSRPKLFVEVDNENAVEFEDWLPSQSYKVASRFRRYEVNENFLCVPDE